MADQLQRRDAVVAWVAIVLVGGTLRLAPSVQAEFPLGDGGLFFAAIEAVRSVGGLPDSIPYNDGIPFVYPPLGFLVAASLTALPGLDTEAVLRFLPPLLAIAVLAIVPWTAARFTGSLRTGLFAGALVAVMPQAYDQLVAGGGVTRGLGVLLALAAMGIAAGPGPRTRRGILTGLLLGLTGLTHPRVAIFALVSVAFTWWQRRASLERRELVVALATGAIVALPWLAIVIERGHLDALLSGGQRFDPVAGLVGLVAYPAMQAMHGGIPNVAVALSITGVGISMISGRWSLPAWLLLVHVLGCPVFVSAIAWAIAGAAGLDLLASNLLRGATLPRRSWSALAGIGILLTTAVLSAGASPADPGSKQQALPPPQVDAAIAMRSLPADARIAVVTSETWGNDLVGEWLPALSGRLVITTPQGAEWLGVDRFAERRDAHQAARDCHGLTSECLASAIARSDLAATHVVIPRGSVGGPRAPDQCCPALLETIRLDDRFHIVMDEPGALVAEWRR